MKNVWVNKVVLVKYNEEISLHFTGTRVMCLRIWYLYFQYVIIYWTRREDVYVNENFSIDVY